MVQKTSHRGVHSGNTLRASSSRYSRRYHNQACIISRVHTDFLKKLVAGSEKAADDSHSGVRNVAVNVALSLNKQSRWLLPSALKRQIASNDIANSGLTLSLLERHKLKRHANCVSFHSNTGAVKRIQPRAGHYFGFQFPSVDGVSRRAQRRQMRMENAKQFGKHKLQGRVLNVFTVDGRAHTDPDIGESEVRYEVFYPCPATSSISHNPKYIKQHLSVTAGDDADHAQHGKPRKQHRRKQRKRMSLKELDDIDLCSLSDYGSRMGVVSEFSEVVQEEQPVGIVQDRASDFLLSSIIEKAERLQQQYLAGPGKVRRRKRSGDSKLYKHYEDDKSHIVYLPTPEAEPDDEASHSKTQLPSPSPSARSEATRVLLPNDDVTTTSLTECFGQNYFEAGCRPRKFVLDVTVNVREVMKKCGVQPKVAEKCGEALLFLIFVHDGFYDDESDVYKVFLNSRLRRGLLAVQMERDTHDLQRGTVLGVVSQTMDFVAGIVTELQEANALPTLLDVSKVKTMPCDLELTHHLAPTEAYTPSVQRVFQQGSDVTNVVIPSFAEMLDEEPSFCDVCYDDVSPLTLDSAACTALLKCGHRVCDTCWEQHVQSRLQQGFVRVTCPGYDCQTEVGVGVLLSVACLDTVDKLLQRQEEVRIGASQAEKWCPGESCGRVLRLQVPASSADGDVDESDLQRDVVCACGAHVCFKCLESAHWPASCKQAQDYRLNLAATVFPNREAEVHDDSEMEARERLRHELGAKKTMVVEGKHCPKCKTFVNKDGGCPNMTCRCGQTFCWYCARPGYAHSDRSCVRGNMEQKLTTTLVVRHIDSMKSAADTEKKKQKKKQQALASRRQKVSLMERAAEHRLRRQGSQSGMNHAIDVLAKTAATAASKDNQLAQHIISVCSTTSDITTTSPKPASTVTTTTLLSRPLSPSDPASQTASPRSIISHITTFLKTAARSKQELHELAEYTLVLVKDLPDSLHRRRALRVAEDLTAFCTFSQSILDVWNVESGSSGQGLGYQEAIKAIVRLAEIQRWVHSALTTHVTTVRKFRSLAAQ